MKNITFYLLATLLTVFTLSCSSDDDTGSENDTEPVELKSYTIELFGSSTYEQRYPLEITYYSDNKEGDLETTTINSQTNTDIIQEEVLLCNNRIGFEYDVDGYEESLINYVRIIDSETEEVIFEENTLEIEDNQLFLYNISEDSYTVE